MYKLVICVMLSFVAVFAGCKSGGAQKTIIVAHRGASALAPENTVASTKLAFAKDADISEIDIYMTKDNRVMVLHDSTTKRTCYGDNMKIAESDSAQLRTLSANKLNGQDYADEKIPFVEEIIDVIPEGKKLFIEIKCGKEVAPYLKEAIDKSGKLDQMVIISGNIEAMNECRKLMPSIPLYWVKASDKDKVTKERLPYDDSVIQTAVENKLTGLDLYYVALTKEFVSKAHAAGLEVYVWTVNDVDLAKQMIEFGVDGITTDVPGVMKASLGL